MTPGNPVQIARWRPQWASRAYSVLQLARVDAAYAAWLRVSLEELAAKR